MLCLSCRTFSRQSINKRSLVCGSGEELAEDPLIIILSAMKSRAYAPEFTPGYISWKKGAIISLVVIWFTFVIRAGLKFARRISLELHYNDCKKLMQMISLILRD